MQMVASQCRLAAWQFQINIIFPAMKQRLILSYEAEEDTESPEAIGSLWFSAWMNKNETMKAWNSTARCTYWQYLYSLSAISSIGFSGLTFRFLWVIIGIIFKRKSKPIERHKDRLFTRQFLFYLHIYSLSNNNVAIDTLMKQFPTHLVLYWRMNLVISM